MQEEFHSTERYLECMKLRFSDELHYTMDIGPGCEDLRIPKLILQPLVENAFKYAFNTTPPWKLHIFSEVRNGKWSITVEDNGGQLSFEKRQELLGAFRSLDTKEELKSMKIGGMGLKNVYLRLKLLYNEEAVFEIDSSVPHHTSFTLGGPAEKEEC